MRKHEGISDPENNIPLVHLKMLNCQKDNVPKTKKPQNVDADFSSDNENLSQVKDGAANCRSKIDKIIGRLGEKPLSIEEF